MHIRPILPSDADGLRDLVHRQSARTVYMRFLSPLYSLSPRLLDHLVRVDYVDRLALVGVLGEQIIAVARYERLPNPVAHRPAEAEVAFLVDDAHQRRGIGTILLEHLAAAAKEAGIGYFVADTLPENTSMLRVFHQAGFGDERTFGDGVVRVVFPIEPTETSVAAMQERERRAAAESVQRLLAPRSVAVIGASRRPDTIGYRMVRNLLLGSFTGPGSFNGPVYPVNPDAHHVSGVLAYATVLHIPEPVDLAIIVVPAAEVPGVIEQCARKRVGSLVVISGGFADAGPQGWEAERRVVAEARRNGMRLVGPTSMGVVNTDPNVRLNATFAPAPPRGRVGLITQSGGLGMVILDELARRGLGVSTFVSAGNKADISGNDLLSYWDGDDATDVIVMYIESFGNPRTFARLARRVARHKPIVAVKSGRSPAGYRAARVGRSLASDGGALQDDGSVDALFGQTGVIRVDTLEELLDVTEVLASGPPPAGRRVAIVVNAGGSGVLAADSCTAAGLEVAELPASTLDSLQRAACVVAVGNPVGLAPDAGPEDFGRAVSVVLGDDGIDAVLAIYTSPTPASLDEIATAVRAASADHPTKPVLVCALGHRGLVHPGADRPTPDTRPADTARTVPFFAFAEAAARALGRVAGYAEWLARPEGGQPKLDGVDPDSARRMIRVALATPPPASPGPTDPGPTDPGPTDPGPTDPGPTDPGPTGPGRWLEADLAAALVAAYGIALDTGAGTSPGGVEAAVRVGVDPQFGPLVTLRAVAERPDRRYPGRIAPLTDVDADELVAAALGGQSGAGAQAALRDVVLRVSRLVDDLPEVAELDLRPLLVSAAGAVAAGVRVRVAPVEPHPELAVRRLRDAGR